ncbi:MFS transporter [Paenibacillus sp. CMAA1364]
MIRKMTLKNHIGYGLGQTSTQIRGMLMSTYLMWFLTDLALFPVAIITLMLTVTKVWDAVNDPFCGWLIDEKLKYGKRGKFRPLYIWSTLASCLIFGLMFTKISSDMTISLIMIWIVYFVSDVIATGEGAAYPSLAGIMSRDKSDRIKLGTWRSVGGLIGGLLVAVGTVPLLKLLGQGDDAKGLTLTVWLFVIISALLAVVTYKSTFETEMPVDEKAKKIKNPFVIVLSVLKNRAVVLTFFTMLASVVALNLRAGFQMYFLQNILGNVYAAGLLGGISMTVMAICIPLVPLVVKRIGVKWTVTLSMGLQILLGVGMLFYKTDLIMLSVFTALTGLALALGNITSFIQQVDSIDYQAWKTGKRSEGMVFSIYGLVVKFGMAAVPGIMGICLIGFGYNPEAVTEHAKLGIEIGYFVLPILFYILAFVAAAFNPMSDKKLSQVRQDLEVRT